VATLLVRHNLVRCLALLVSEKCHFNLIRQSIVAIVRLVQ
jgi:hypothetical protein